MTSTITSLSTRIGDRSTFSCATRSADNSYKNNSSCRIHKELLRYAVIAYSHIAVTKHIAFLNAKYHLNISIEYTAKNYKLLKISFCSAMIHSKLFLVFIMHYTQNLKKNILKISTIYVKRYYIYIYQFID